MRLTIIATLPPLKKTEPGKCSSLSFVTCALSLMKPILSLEKRSIAWISIFFSEYGVSWNGCFGFECWSDRECCNVECHVLNAGKEVSSDWDNEIELGTWTGTEGSVEGKVNVDIVARLLGEMCRNVARRRGSM